MDKWPKLGRIPTKFFVHPKYHVKVRFVPPSEIQGNRGEWVQHEDPEDPCFGIIRISNQLQTDEAIWLTFREEMQHALIDAQRFFMVDYILRGQNGEDN